MLLTTSLLYFNYYLNVLLNISACSTNLIILDEQEKSTVITAAKY